MKKLLLGITLCYASFTLQAQDLINKIPSNAAVVASIKGKNVMDLFSAKEFEESKIGKKFLKRLSRNSNGKITNLNALGLDLSNSFYYFLEAEKGIFSNYFLIPMKSSKGFMSLLSKHEKEKVKTEGNVSYMQKEYDGVVTMWDENALLVVFSEDTTKNDDHSSYDYSETEVKNTEIIEVVEDAVEIEETVIEGIEDEAVIEYTEVEVVEEAYETTKDVVEETVIESTETDYNNDYYKKQQERRDKERKEREAKRVAKRERIAKLNLEKAKAIMFGNYTNNNILKSSSYRNSLGKGNHEAHVWVNDFMKIYQQTLSEFYGISGFNPFELYGFNTLYKGTSVTSTLNFKEDNVSVNLNYTMSEALAKHTKAMYNGTMNKNFFKYFNENQMLGYFAINASMEGILTEYPKLMESMFVNAKENEMAKVAPLATELLSIFLDEKAIAELVRGDMLFVINDITKKQVTYTTYDYDEDYNRVSVEKTKEETVPDFLFMATSNGQSIFNKLMGLGKLEKELTYENGIYKIKTPRSVPVNLYLMHTNGVLFFGTSKEHLTAIKNGTYSGNVSSTHKKYISKNSSVVYINGKKIVSQIPAKEMPREFKNKIDFMSDNTEDLIFKSGKIKGNTINSTLILNTPTQGHKNSLAYFINFIDAFID